MVEKKKKEEKRRKKIKVFLASIRYETTSFHKRVTHVHFTRIFLLLRYNRRSEERFQFRFLLFDAIKRIYCYFCHRERVSEIQLDGAGERRVDRREGSGNRLSRVERQ